MYLINWPVSVVLYYIPLHGSNVAPLRGQLPVLCTNQLQPPASLCPAKIALTHQSTKTSEGFLWFLA